MNHSQQNDSTEAIDDDVEAKISEIEEAVIELTELCESHDELMALLHKAIDDKRRENAILAALSAMDEDAVAAMAASLLPVETQTQRDD